MKDLLQKYEQQDEYKNKVKVKLNVRFLIVIHVN